MRILRRLLICLLLLPLGLPLHAQWNGSLDLTGGFGAIEGNGITDNGEPMVHALVQGTVKVGYTKPKFFWGTTLKGKWEPKTTDNSRLQLKNEKLLAMQKSASTKPLSLSLQNDFIFTPSTVRKYSAWLLMQYDNDRAQNHSLDMRGTKDEMENLSYYYETPRKYEVKLETGLKTYRGFDNGSILEGLAKVKLVFGVKNTTWLAFKSDPEGQAGGTHVTLEDDIQGYTWKYRITPFDSDLDFDGDIHYRMNVLDQDVKLKLTPGARLITKRSVDENSGATRIQPATQDHDEVWRDSTRLKEDFDYLCLQAEPYVVADFAWKSLSARADYALQVYGRRLNDDTHTQPLHVKGIYPVGKANVKWTISPRHSLNLINELSVNHPDYLKICWYDRTAGYMDQLYRGNESLLSPFKTRLALEYAFRYNRFLSTTTVSYTYVADEIDQTWSNKEIDGRPYKVFEWLNSADSRTAGFIQSLGWRGKIITANASITYNKSRRIARSDGTIKNSFDWSLKGDIAANLGKGWTVSANAKYQSKVATFFTLFKQYCELNARVQKDFKTFTVYLEGKDLLDQPRETEFYSDELKEYWIEQVRSNRRMVVVGVKWNF